MLPLWPACGSPSCGTDADNKWQISMSFQSAELADDVAPEHFPKTPKP
jgi:hypothetical protein